MYTNDDDASTAQERLSSASVEAPRRSSGTLSSVSHRTSQLAANAPPVMVIASLERKREPFPWRRPSSQTSTFFDRESATPTHALGRLSSKTDQSPEPPRSRRRSSDTSDATTRDVDLHTLVSDQAGSGSSYSPASKADVNKQTSLPEQEVDRFIEWARGGRERLPGATPSHARRQRGSGGGSGGARRHAPRSRSLPADAYRRAHTVDDEGERCSSNSISQQSTPRHSPSVVHPLHVVAPDAISRLASNTSDTTCNTQASGLPDPIVALSSFRGASIHVSELNRSSRDKFESFGDNQHGHGMPALLSVNDASVATTEIDSRREPSHHDTPDHRTSLGRSRTSHRSTPLDVDQPTNAEAPADVAHGDNLNNNSSREPTSVQRLSPRVRMLGGTTSMHDTYSGSEGMHSQRSRSDVFQLSQSSMSFNSARAAPSFFRASLVAAMNDKNEELAAALDRPMTAATYSLHHTHDSPDPGRSFGEGSHFGGSSSAGDVGDSSVGSSVFMSQFMRGSHDDEDTLVNSFPPGAEAAEDDANAQQRQAQDSSKQPVGADEDENVTSPLHRAMLSGPRIQSTKELPEVPLETALANGLDLDVLHRLHKRAREGNVEEQTRVYHRLLLDPETQQRFHVLNEKYVVYPVEIGRGSFSRVKLVYSLVDRCFYALKIMNRHRLQRFTFGSGDAASSSGPVPTREASLLGALRHRNIIALREFLNDPGMRHVLFVLELAEGGEVMTIHDDGRIMPFEDGLTSFPESQSQRIIYGIVNALTFAHKMGVAHRDVKPANVLVTAEGEVKLSDFGASVLVDEARFKKLLRQGSVAFLAPEVLLAQEVMAAPRSSTSSSWASTFATSRGLAGSDRQSTQFDSSHNNTYSTTTNTTVTGTPSPHQLHNNNNNSNSVSSSLTAHGVTGEATVDDIGHVTNASDALSHLLTSYGPQSSQRMSTYVTAPTTGDTAETASAPGTATSTGSLLQQQRTATMLGASGVGPIGKPPLIASRRGPPGSPYPWSGSLNSSARNQQFGRGGSWYPGSMAATASLTHDVPGSEEFSGGFDTTLYSFLCGDEDHNAPVVDLFKVDVFALGVTAFALLMGRLPWIATDATHQFTAIATAPDPFLSAYQSAYGPGYEPPASYQAYYTHHQSPQQPHKNDSALFGHVLPRSLHHTNSSASVASAASAPALPTGSSSYELPPPVPTPLRVHTIGKGSISSSGPPLTGSRSNSTMTLTSADRTAGLSHAAVSSEGSKSYSSANLTGAASSTNDPITSDTPRMVSTLDFTVSSSMWMDAVDTHRSCDGAEEPASFAAAGAAHVESPRATVPGRGLPAWRPHLPPDVPTVATQLPLTAPLTVGSGEAEVASAPSTDKYLSISDTRGGRGGDANAKSRVAASSAGSSPMVAPLHFSQHEVPASPLVASPHDGSATQRPDGLAVPMPPLVVPASVSTRSSLPANESTTTTAAAAEAEDPAQQQAGSQSSLESIEGLLRERLSSDSSRDSFEVDDAARSRLLEGTARRSFVIEETLDLPADSTHGPISALAVDFVRACLHPDALQRRTAFELCTHPWILQAVELARERHRSLVTEEDDAANDRSVTSTEQAVASGASTPTDEEGQAQGRSERVHDTETGSWGDAKEHGSLAHQAQPSLGILENVHRSFHHDDNDEDGDAHHEEADNDGDPLRRGDEDVRWLPGCVTEGSLPQFPPSSVHMRGLLNSLNSVTSFERGASQLQHADWQVSTTDDPGTDDGRSAGTVSLYDSAVLGGPVTSTVISPLTALSLGASMNPDTVGPNSLNGTARSAFSVHIPASAGRGRHGSVSSTPAVSGAFDPLTSPCTVSTSSLAVTVSSNAPHDGTVPHTASQSALDEAANTSQDRVTFYAHHHHIAQPLQLSSSASHGADTDERNSHNALSLPSTAYAATDEGTAPRSLSVSSTSGTRTPDLTPPTASSDTSTRRRWLECRERPVSLALRQFLGSSQDGPSDPQSSTTVASSSSRLQTDSDPSSHGA